MTERAAPGEVRLTPWAPRMAWPTRKAISAGHRADREGDGPEGAGLGGDDQVSLGGGGEGGADHAGGVFAGDDQHAENGDGQLGDQDPRQAGQDRVEAGGLRAGVGGGVDGAVADHGDNGDGETPVGGADAAHLGPLGAQQVGQD